MSVDKDERPENKTLFFDEEKSHVTEEAEKSVCCAAAAAYTVCSTQTNTAPLLPAPLVYTRIQREFTAVQLLSA